MKILIAGSTGQVGWEIARSCPAEWTLIATDRSQLDMAKPETIASTVHQAGPDVIVNATGYTAVDRAESEPDLARLVNAEAVGVLANAAKSCGAAIVHFSTDYIFDGRKTAPYLPSDAPNPQSVYGRTKLEGEQAIIASGASYVILRTQWVYAMRGRNFVLAILKQAGVKPELRVVNDQTGAPTWARAIARATVRIASSGIRGKEGVYHLACGGSTTWFHFAQTVFEEAAAHRPGTAMPRVKPVSTAEYGAKAARPAHAILDCTSTETAFGVRMPTWREALREAMSDRAALQAALAPSTPR